MFPVRTLTRDGFVWVGMKVISKKEVTIHGRHQAASKQKEKQACVSKLNGI